LDIWTFRGVIRKSALLQELADNKTMAKPGKVGLKVHTPKGSLRRRRRNPSIRLLDIWTFGRLDIRTFRREIRKSALLRELEENKIMAKPNR